MAAQGQGVYSGSHLPFDHTSLGYRTRGCLIKKVDGVGDERGIEAFGFFGILLFTISIGYYDGSAYALKKPCWLVQREACVDRKAKQNSQGKVR